MQQNFDVLSLVHVFNPLYALPIVTVILCAFLVYAFGFKSPVQPPSFDELIEIEKKPAKKRKIKENQKGKQQNGKIPAAAVKTNENASIQVKKKPGKSEEKAVPKKTSTVEKKKKQNINQNPSPAIDDTNDEGWVHHVSKKGRKNKKKDDATSTEVSEPLIIHEEEVKAVDTLSSLQNNYKLENKIVNGSKEVIDVAHVKEHLIEKVADVQVKLTSKQNVQKKQQAKNKVDVANDSGKLTAYNKADEQVCKNGLEHPSIIESESSEVESSVVSDPTKVLKEQKQPKKKKKKKQDSDEKNNADVSPDVPAVDKPFIKCPPNKTVLSSALPIMNSHEVTEIVVNQEKDLSEKMSLIVDEIKDVRISEVDGKGSNVAFDELEGLCLDSKVTKKKKRVRRDH